MFTTIVLAGWLAGCTGPGGSVEDNRPDDDILLDDGEIGVDARTNQVFVRGPGSLTTRVLAAHLDDAEAREVLDVGFQTDVRLAFTQQGVVSFGESQGGGTSQPTLETIHRLDRRTLELEDVRTAEHGFGVPRVSPSGKWIALFDREAPNRQRYLWVMDTRDLSLERIPVQVQDAELVWAGDRDLLILAGFKDIGRNTARITVRAWSFEDEVPGQDRPWWLSKEYQVKVKDQGAYQPLGFVWAEADPTGRFVAFPTRRYVGPATPFTSGRPWAHAVLVVDTRSGAFRWHDDLSGPVAFLPDGEVMVGYDPLSNGDIVLAEPMGNQGTRIPIGPEPVYFLTPDDHQLVATSFEGGPVFLHDLDSGDTTQLDAQIPLDSFVYLPGRREMWSVAGDLFRLDLVTGETEQLDLDPLVPRNLNRLHEQDVLVFDDEASPTLSFWDPVARDFLRQVALDEARPLPPER